MDVAGESVLELFDRRVVLITGKGGVGRTTLTAALALAGARRGRRVLVTEVTDPDVEYTPLARLFGREMLPVDPEPLAPGVRGCVLWAKRGHERFFRKVLPIPALVNAALNSGPLRRMLEAAPSLTEMGVFYHLLSLILETRDGDVPEHELILVDMPASGHTLGLTGLPERILEVMPRGPIARAMREGQALLYDPAFAGAWVVALPERLPVTEAIELLEGLEQDRMPLGGVLLNRWLDDPFTAGERAALAPVLAEAAVFGRSRFIAAERAQAALDELVTGTALPVHRVPERAEVGQALIEALAAELAAA